jgi:nucleotide-binding universal stress UspA family protein
MTWQPKTIMAAVDGSDSSSRAAQRAADLARLTGAELVVLTVVRPPEGWWGLEGAPPTPEAFATAVAAGRREVLDKVMATLDLAGVRHRTLEEIGEPATVIAGVAEQEQADLLVVGRRGAGMLERLMLGSVADRLAHTAPCPLVIVP